MAYETEAAKTDQIAHRLFTKFTLIVDNARNAQSDTREDGKTEKWFNLETPDTDVYKDQLRMYKSVSKLGGSPPPLELQVLLSVPDLTNNQVLVYHPPNASRVHVDPTPTHILLESWNISFVATVGSETSSRTSSYASSGGSSPVGPEVTPATVYKHAIATFRSLYTLLRILPAWRLCKRPRRSRSGNVVLRMRVRDSGASADWEGTEVMRVLGFGSRLSPRSPPLQTESFTFDNITHPMGFFALGVTYLQSPHFEVDTFEALESSRILSLNSGPGLEFTPTLARNAARDSMSSSPGSLPMRTSLPRSPPSSVPKAGIVGPATAGVAGLGLGQPTNSVADRYVLPANNASRTSFPSTSPRSRNIALPSTVQRSTSAAYSGSPGASVGSSSRLSREEPVSSIASRTRKESTGMRISELPSASGGVPIRRPSLVQPFKSSALSSGTPSLYSNSPSLKTGSPLMTGPSLPSRPQAPSSPTTGRPLGPFRSDPPSAPISAAGIAPFRAGSSPVLPLRPSPPGGLGPSSLSERRFPAIASSVETGASGSSTEKMASGAPSTSGGVGPVPVQRRKRYSSSFGYRYGASGGANSDVSAGSAEKGKEKEGNASYLSTNTDDDDISAFVQEIDSRRPIGPGLSHDRDRTLSEAGGQTEQQVDNNPRSSPSFRGRTISEGPLGQRSSSLARHAAAMAAAEQPKALLTSQFAIDEQLKQLNDKYNASMNVMERRPGSRDKEKITGRRSGSFSSERGVNVDVSGGTPPSPLGRSPLTPAVERSSPLSRQVGAEAMPRRVATTAGGEYSVWANREERPLSRRVRTESAASGASGLSDLDRARLYIQSRATRGSAGSIGSEEVLGKLELDK